MMKLPFGLFPGSWGLKGKTREVAKAEYEFTGETLQKKLIEINYEDEDERQLELLKLERKNKHITKEEYDYRYIELKYKGTAEYVDIALELDRKYEKISEIDYQKKSATLNEEPWVGVVHSEYTPGELSDGFSFELDWNVEFIKLLKHEGYSGATEEEIVEQWFEDKATEQYLGILGEEMADMAETDDWSVPATHTSRETMEDGKTRHS